MNKGDFVGGIQVILRGTDQVMTLGGTPDDWVCTFVKNGKSMSEHFQPEVLDPFTGASQTK